MNRQSFPVELVTYEYVDDGTEIYFPQIIDYHDKGIQNVMNRQIEQAVFGLVAKQKKQQGVKTFDQMIGQYELKTNERNVLSLTLSNYAIHEHFAHGLTFITSLNFDIETGKDWSLSEQFNKNSDYEARLAAIINRQIEDRDLPVFNEPVKVNPEQDYYIADKSLVIYFQLYEISPYYVGLPMFPITIYQVEDILAPNGLLTRMLG